MSDLGRLDGASLSRLPGGLQRPAYDRAALEPGVIHIGSGAFHRAHQGPVFDDLAAAGDLTWGVIDIGLRSGEGALRLADQDGLYALEVRGGTAQPRIVGSIMRALVAKGQPAACHGSFADPRIALVTLTITENGYADPATLNFIAGALNVRRRAGLPGLSLISCDNLSSNSARLRRALLKREPLPGEEALREWIESACAFPSTVVDRITPTATDADRESFANRFGVADQALTVTEAYSQWVIEDAFAGRRPDFNRAGVRLVSDVAPFALAKLRLLNAAHSAMAWLGLMAGFEFIHQIAATREARAYLERLWDEAADTLPPATDLDLPAYRANLLHRFANAALPHRLTQIAQDSGAKLGPRLVEPLEVRLDRGLTSPAMALAVAAYVLWAGPSQLPLSGRIIACIAPALQALKKTGAMAAMAGPVS